MGNKKLEILIIGDYVNDTFNNHEARRSFLNFIATNDFFNVDFDNNTSKVYDACIVLHQVFEREVVNVYKGNVFVLMQEPGTNKIIHPFMDRQLYQFDKVYSSIYQSKNTVLSHGYQWWYVLQSYEELTMMKSPKKTKKVSCVMANTNGIEGHRIRLKFREFIRDAAPEIDFFGKDLIFVKNKADALLKYQYSIAVENSSQDYYFTEKINDCFLCYTIPFYYGCTNISKFFPEKSYVWIDITNPKKALKTMRDTIEMEDPKDRLPYIEEARQLVLEKYNSIRCYFRKKTIKNKLNRVKLWNQ